LEAKKRYFAANAKYRASKRNPSHPTQEIYPSLQGRRNSGGTMKFPLTLNNRSSIMKTHRFLSFVAIIAIAFTFSFSQEEGKKIRTGARIALINSATIDSYQEINQGFTIEGVFNIPIVNTLIFNPGVSFGYRVPFKGRICKKDSGCQDRENVEIWEIPISLFALIRGMPLGGPMFYLEAGLQLDTPPIFCEEPSGFNRTKYGFGPLFGFGWNINERLAIGIRSFYSITEFTKNSDYLRTSGNLFQIGLGLTYLY
jgi:hypothetical protein